MKDEPQQLWVREKHGRLLASKAKLGNALHMVEYDAYLSLKEDNLRLRGALAREFNENDEFGAEYLGITILREENNRLREYNIVISKGLNRIIEHNPMEKPELALEILGHIIGEAKAALAHGKELLKNEN